jgi:hypothetical protein
MSIYGMYLEESLSRLRTVLDDSGSRPILFVGSGLSRRYLGAPDWLGLLEQLISLNPKITMPIGFFTQNTNNNLPAVASALVDEYQTFAWEQYGSDVFPKELYDHSFSKSIFLKYQVTQIMDALINPFQLQGHALSEELSILRTLKPHAIITTNYDGLLEELFPNFNVVIGQQVIRKKEATNIGHILKIHGSYTNPEEIVISSKDYEMFHYKQKYLIAKLLTYFMEHPIVFLGYSITDSNIKNILSDISEIVSGETDEIVNNIWFVEWKKDEIAPDFKPPSDKTIDLGEGKNIRINYLLVNSFEQLYSSLYQNTAVGIDTLRELQNNIYNIVKSKTITDLEVDMVNIKNITDVDALAKLIGIEHTDNIEASGEKIRLLGIGNITDPEKLMTMYPMRISQVAEKLGLSYWYGADKAIKQIQSSTGFNLKESNNIYHINLGINQAEHRYSMEAVELLKKVMNNENCSVVVDDVGSEVSVTLE